jgi:formylglycine-generating enzyme required for sulfatase activity
MGRRWAPVASRGLGPVATALLAATLIAGCAEQELYRPPQAPFGEIGHLELPSEPQGVAVLGDYAYVAAGQAGLIVVDLLDPTNPRLERIIDTVKFAESIRVASASHTVGVVDIAFVVEGTEGVTTYDITDPPNAYSFQQGTTAVDGNGLFVELPEDPSEPYVVYLAESWKGLRIFESDPQIPGLLRYQGVFASTRGYARAVTVNDGYAYVADDEMGVAVVDVRDRVLGAVRVVASCDTHGNARGIDHHDGYLYVADYEHGLVVMRIEDEGDPAVPTPHVVGELGIPGRCQDVVVRDGVAFVAAQDGGLCAVDVSVPSSPVDLGRIVMSNCIGIALTQEGLVIAVDQEEGLLVLDRGAPFADTVAPAEIRDLAASAVNSTTVRLDWHAPGDDRLSGTASAYDARWASAAITTEEDWDAATPADGEPAPSVRGSAESFDVTGLEPGGTYWFAVRTADEGGNWSGLSNVVSATTITGNAPPVLRDEAVSPLGGTVDSLFVFEITYEDGDGDAPAVAEVRIDGAGYAMTFVSGSVTTGARYRYETMLAIGAHERSYRFSDGVNPDVATADAPGPWVGVFSFPMGSPADEPGRDSDETRHPVVLTRNFWISDHEVTQAEYEALMGTNPSRFAGVDLPVESVSWLDAVAYCNARSADEGLTPAYTIDGPSVGWNEAADGYRLPTEAEWELACRAGSDQAFSGGPLTEQACGTDPVLDPLGWYCGNAGSTTHAVGTKAANAWGLYDLHGNVWEWCWDWYLADPGAGLAVDPAGPGGGSQKVIRGGSWYYFARDCRSASRAPYWPNSQDDVVGFRVARTVP